MRLKIESVRARLTFFYVVVLAAVLLIVGSLAYVLLDRVLSARIDEGLAAMMQIATTSLDNDLAEGQDVADAARSTAAELAAREQILAIYDSNGRLLAESGRDDDVEIQLPALETISSTETQLTTITEARDDDDRHRLATRRVTLPRHNATYIVVAGSSLEPTDEELEALRGMLGYVVPIALLLAGLGGWFLAHRSLAPVVAMAERARRLGGEDLGGRLPVANPRDELGQLAETFNELLGRLEQSMKQQRQFMADASHELRTPITTTRTAANVALQQRHRDEDDYRTALSIVEQQATRLSRIVDDMFTLARADAGNYPVRRQPMYLDEVVEEVVSAARVLAATRDVRVEFTGTRSASFVGDEELIRRMVMNLLDNAARHSPSGAVVNVSVHTIDAGYAIVVADEGQGIPPDSQPHIFERFYRVDAARGSRDGGAGLGLALVRWVAVLHGGKVALTSSSGAGSTFTVELPSVR
ncbi:MAG TPA: heavy metal sensor histidine kinase [Vicinamibacterales bacterium]|nr:heavy metal sensor histidine kinase [Vicinamibacterales bacterium]